MVNDSTNSSYEPSVFVDANYSAGRGFIMDSWEMESGSPLINRPAVCALFQEVFDSVVGGDGLMSLLRMREGQLVVSTLFDETDSGPRLETNISSMFDDVLDAKNIEFAQAVRGELLRLVAVIDERIKDEKDYRR